MSAKATAPSIGDNGSPNLPLVTVDSYNLEIKDSDGFIGDRASKGAFLDIVEELRAKIAGAGVDPLGDIATDSIGKRRFERILSEGEPEAAGLVLAAVESFAESLAGVIRRFVRVKEWRDVERIVVGGGFRESRVGELAIGRASVALKLEGIAVTLQPIRHHPDEAGLLGCMHLAPPWIFGGHDGIVAVDIGGSNFRAGIVELRREDAEDFTAARVWKSDLWRHADDKPDRDEAVTRLIDMIATLLKEASKSKLNLAPFIGIGCPGLIDADGFIERGAQNLPGNWESSRFHLAQCVRERIPSINGHETIVLMHNDAVVQGLSEAPFMRDVDRWAVVTIGTGLGNASFSNRRDTAGKTGKRG